MSLESLWDPDFALLLTESTPLPGDVFSLFDEVHRFAKDPINAGNCHGKRKSDDESAPGLAKKRHFAAPLTEKQIADCCQPSVPKNTQKKYFMRCYIVCSRTGAAAAISNHHKSIQKISSPHLILPGSSITHSCQPSRFWWDSPNILTSVLTSPVCS